MFDALLLITIILCVVSMQYSIAKATESAAKLIAMFIVTIINNHREHHFRKAFNLDINLMIIRENARLGREWSC